MFLENSIYNKLKKFNHEITQKIEWICGVMGLIALLIVILQMFLRVAFHFALPWAIELVSYIFVFAVFLGAIKLVLENRLVSLTFLVELLPTSIQSFFQYFNILVLIIIGVSIIFGAIIYIPISRMWTMSNIPFPAYLLSYAIILFGFGLVYNAGFLLIKEFFNNRKKI